jgi:hypothetical protein
MKILLLILLFFIISTDLSSQCLDIYGHTVECPTIDDSLVIYNNSLKVYSFYENNKAYKKISSIRLNTKLDVTNCFYKLDSSLDNFKMIWQKRERRLAGENLGILMPRNGENIAVEEYYQKIDEYRFYQREFENGILNITSPFPMYDTRIAPLVINKYINYTANDYNNGDEVEIALYIPVTVKPYSLLTEDEMKLRQKILGVKPKYVTSNIFPKRKVIMKTDSVVKPMYLVKPNKKDSILEPSEFKYPLFNGNITNPIYASNGYTSCLIGWLVGRKFRKLKPEEYVQFAVPLYGRELLQNEKELDKTLRIKFGEYYQGIL